MESDLAKGVALVASRNFCLERFGSTAWQRVCDALPREDIETLDRVAESDWFALAIYDRLSDAIEQVLGAGDLRTMVDPGYYAAAGHDHHDAIVLAYCDSPRRAQDERRALEPLPTDGYVLEHTADAITDREINRKTRRRENSREFYLQFLPAFPPSCFFWSRIALADLEHRTGSSERRSA